MNFAVAGLTALLVIPAELPDKTFISTLMLSAKNRALPVFAGALAGLVLQAGVAAVAGRLLDLLPHEAVAAVVTTLFLAGGAYLLFVPEKVEEERGAALSDGVAASSDETRGALRIGLVSFGIITLAEFGDITQILVANLSARYHAPLSVFVGAALGFTLTVTFGVAAGQVITRIVPLSTVRRIGGLALAGLGIWSLVGLIRS